MPNGLEDQVTTDFDTEFTTVELLRNCNAETRGVDAFALSLLKAERQMRRLFTFLVFQFPCFGNSDVATLRKALTRKPRIYFEGFIKGLDALSPISIKQLIGADHDRLRQSLDEAVAIRNKIFHGQLTDRYLSRDDLFTSVDDIEKWCRLLAESTDQQFGYDGFGRNSYRKATDTSLPQSLKVQIASVSDYEIFLKRVLSR